MLARLDPDEQVCAESGRRMDEDAVGLRTVGHLENHAIRVRGARRRVDVAQVRAV